MSPASSENEIFLGEFWRRFRLPEVLAQIEWLRGLKVAVVGETIIDEYAYCDPMGKSGKEPILVMRHRSCEVQAGGAVAIANHVSEMCGHVELVSALGAIDTREEFVRSRLRPAVRAEFVYKAGSPTITKRRYLDAYSLAKLFGIYQINDEPLGERDEEAFLARLAPALERADVVIVADYGHGLLTPRAIDLLCERARFLALNTQLNAANAGFHTLSKYPHADYVCVHEGELRLDARDARGEVRPLMESAVRRMRRAEMAGMMVTRGKRGTLLYCEGRGRDGFYGCPSFATDVVERVGAGDAVLAVTAPAMATGLPPDVVSLIGNLAGAQAVAVVGNSASISKDKLCDRVRALVRRRAQRRAMP